MSQPRRLPAATRCSVIQTSCDSYSRPDASRPRAKTTPRRGAFTNRPRRRLRHGDEQYRRPLRGWRRRAGELCRGFQMVRKAVALASRSPWSISAGCMIPARRGKRLCGGVPVVRAGHQGRRALGMNNLRPDVFVWQRRSSRLCRGAPFVRTGHRARRARGMNGLGESTRMVTASRNVTIAASVREGGGAG